MQKSPCRNGETGVKQLERPMKRNQQRKGHTHRHDAAAVGAPANAPPAATVALCGRLKHAAEQPPAPAVVQPLVDAMKEGGRQDRVDGVIKAYQVPSERTHGGRNVLKINNAPRSQFTCSTRESTERVPITPTTSSISTRHYHHNPSWYFVQ